ncbi:hypothetical protein [Corallococcus exiguus]|uniref:hypothetical protein n=1 Tax=Corallococcus exiguus TaxID=83462 RepID=UPI003DA3E0ED
MRNEFDAMVEKEGMRSHEPVLSPGQPDPVEEFIGRNPGEAYDVCVDALKKNLRPARDEEYRAADMALRCVSASGNQKALAFLEWVAFEATADSFIAGQAVYFIGTLAPGKMVWALVRRLEMESYPGARSRLVHDLLLSQDPVAAESLDDAVKRETDEAVRRQMIRSAYLLRHSEQCVRYGVKKKVDGEMPVCEYMCVGRSVSERSTSGSCPEYILAPPVSGK